MGLWTKLSRAASRRNSARPISFGFVIMALGPSLSAESVFLWNWPASPCRSLLAKAPPTEALERGILVVPTGPQSLALNSTKRPSTQSAAGARLAGARRRPIDAVARQLRHQHKGLRVEPGGRLGHRRDDSDAVGGRLRHIFCGRRAPGRAHARQGRARSRRRPGRRGSHVLRPNGGGRNGGRARRAASWSANARAVVSHAIVVRLRRVHDHRRRRVLGIVCGEICALRVIPGVQAGGHAQAGRAGGGGVPDEACANAMALLTTQLPSLAQADTNVLIGAAASTTSVNFDLVE